MKRDRWRTAVPILTAALLLPALACAAARSHEAAAAGTAVLPLTAMGESGESAVQWDFRIDRGRGAGKWKQIRMPSCWEQEGFGTYYYGTQGRGKPDDDPIIPKERGHYRTQFVVPAEWRDRHVRVVFEGAMTDTEVRVNGESVGETHQGGFYRFHYDITERVVFGAKNVLEVMVDKESSNESVNRAERRGDYWTFGGIYRPVWLEARPADHIDWTAIDARADGSFYAQVHLGSAPPAGSTVSAHIYDANGEAVGQPLFAPVGSGSTTAVLRGQLRAPSPWSAEHPYLYRVRFALHRAFDSDENGSLKRCTK
jgi:beta-galactosidase/beta-glucuronidase